MRAVAVVALGCVVAACGAGAVSSRTAATVPRPHIVLKLIPFGAKRRAETVAYAKRHYGIDTWRLDHPHVIVEHYTAADSFVVQAEHNVAVPKIALTTIDLLVTELKLPKVDMIKMDIKGATQRALTGGRQTLAANKPRLAISTEETVDNPKDVASFIESMRLGYRVECGTCSMESLRVHPDVLLFR